MMKSVSTICLVLFASLQAATYESLSGALRKVLPSGQKVFKSKLVLDKAQAKILNDFGHGDFLADDAIDVYYTKDDKGQVSGTAVHLVEYLVRWKSTHTWVVGLAPDGKLTGISVVELTDKYAFPLGEAGFLKQFAGKAPPQSLYGKGMDAVSGASASCQLLSSSIQRAVWISKNAKLP
ncbi:MAG TPA: FMN-binding protein [Fibrobacteria bacterium]|nr:FMN-binding protein [Fibrobacteria bacterium]